MSIARVACRAQVGLTAPAVEVEVHLGSGLPSFTIVGLAATEVKESKERVRAALANAGFEWPAGRITVNLAPADLPKDGGRFDLAIAIGILVASHQVGPDAETRLQRSEYLGELGLGGELRPIRGALVAARAAAAAGHDLVLPRANAVEMRLLPSLDTWAAANLLEAWSHLAGKSALPAARSLAPATTGAASMPSGPEPASGASVAQARAVPLLSLDDVCGQALAKRALQVAAAGGHSLLMVGPPGCGKSMLAQRLTALLPPLSETEAIEVATVASVIGTAGAAGVWPVARPFRAPHHTASAAAIIGGGAQARPGEITLAHLGVLFLDEFPEFDRRVLEALREPLESGLVSISRAGLQADYPARFQLVAAMNPCPCGHLGDRTRACRCKPPDVLRYRSRLSGPLLDRIDLRVELEAVSEVDLAGHRVACNDHGGMSSTAAADRVGNARARQLQRQGRLNVDLAAPDLDRWARPTVEATNLLSHARTKLSLSMRGTHRTQRVARTLADLDGVEQVGLGHIAEAIQLRRALAAE